MGAEGLHHERCNAVQKKGGRHLFSQNLDKKLEENSILVIQFSKKGEDNKHYEIETSIFEK